MSEFPRYSVWLYSSNLISDDLNFLLSVADLFAEGPNYWISKDSIINNTEQVEKKPISLSKIETIILQLYGIIKSKLNSDWIGAEFWFQVYENGKGLAFHFDKDEKGYLNNGKMRHPAYSSILYLTGNSNDNLRQACTVILDQTYDNDKKCPVPKDPEKCVIVPPETGKYCVFDGKLGHGVLESSNLSKRVTMLINWWTHEKPIEIEAYKSSESDVNLNYILNKNRDIRQLQYPVVRVPEDDEDISEHGILVDDLMDLYLLESNGENAIHGLCVNYDKFTLYPLDPSKTKQDISQKLIIPGAFIPRGKEVGP